MSDRKARAVALRKKGKSYSEIRGELGVAKSTLSFWLKEVRLSPDAQRRLARRTHVKSIAALIQRNKNQTVIAALRAKGIVALAKKEMRRLQKNPLFLLGVALYWAEGYTRHSKETKWKCVDFANADPTMVRLMMRFFREVCHVQEKEFRVQIMAHPGTSERTLRHFWNRITVIDPKQFFRVSRAISIASQKKQKARLPYGTVHIRVYNVTLFHRLIGWIEGIKKLGGA